MHWDTSSSYWEVTKGYIPLSQNKQKLSRWVRPSPRFSLRRRKLLPAGLESPETPVSPVRRFF
jgi:hypothetical protein